MSKRGNRYSQEFRYQIVQLVRAGRDMRGAHEGVWGFDLVDP